MERIDAASFMRAARPFKATKEPSGDPSQRFVGQALLPATVELRAPTN